MPNYAASMGALSTKFTSFTLLSLLSAVVSALVIGAAYADWNLCRTALSTAYSDDLVFPAVWTTLWTGVSYASPVGHLLTWSRPVSLEGYRWMVPLLGSASQDWIAASWAVVLSRAFQSWYMGHAPTQELEDHQPTETTSLISRPARTRPPRTPLLALTLVLLTVPSFFLTNTPLPVSNVDIATPIGVGCINPPFQRSKKYTLDVVDYIKESQLYTNRARLLLWPEGAVRFNSEQEREAAFADIRANVTGSYVGVSFEQVMPDPSDTTGRKSIARTGVAVIDPHSDQPYLIYWKQHLVPGKLYL